MPDITLTAEPRSERGSRPAGVIVQHAPKRKVLGDFPMVPMPTAASEIALIEAFVDTRVIGVTINHEEMTEDERDDGKEKVQDLLKSFEDKIADMGDKKSKEIMEQ